MQHMDIVILTASIERNSWCTRLVQVQVKNVYAALAEFLQINDMFVLTNVPDQR